MRILRHISVNLNYYNVLDFRFAMFAFTRPLRFTPNNNKQLENSYCISKFLQKAFIMFELSVQGSSIMAYEMCDDDTHNPLQQFCKE